jgi:PKD repeat protein
VGYYTFSSIGDHSVVLEVTDPDGIGALKKDKISISSILSLDFTVFPRVIQREQFVKIVAESQHAKFFEWDFGDGDTE